MKFKYLLLISLSLLFLFILKITIFMNTDQISETRVLVSSKEMKKISFEPITNIFHKSEWGTPYKKIRMSIYSKRNQFLVGEPVTYSIKYKNEGEKTIWLPKSYPDEIDYEVSILNFQMKNVQRLKNKRNTHHSILNQLQNQEVRFRIGSQREVNDSVQIIANSLFDLTNPGIYFLTVKRKFVFEGEKEENWVSSNTVKFEILENKNITTDIGSKGEGFQLTALIENNVFQSKDPIFIKLGLRNISKRNLSCLYFSIESDFQILIKRKDNKDIQLTEYGKNVSSPHFSRVNIVSLAPFESMEGALLVSKIYNMQEPGEYEITIKKIIPKLSGDGWAELMSNPITIKVQQFPVSL